MKPAVLALYESQREKFDSRGLNRNLSVFQEAEKFIREAVNEAIKRFIRGNNFPIKSSLKILKKLKELKIMIGVTNGTLPMSELDNFYKDLKLNGSEGLFESIREMEIFSYKIKNEQKDSQRTKITKMLVNAITYQPSTTNILCMLIIFYFY